MELRHLRYFITAAEERNMTRAAKKLFISQPPLTRAIMQLEDELGVKLFERKARGLDLTAAGAYFLVHAQHLLERLEIIISDTKRINEQRKTVFSIGFEPSIFYGQLPLLVRRLRKNKNLEIILREMTTHNQLHALETGKIDIVFGRVRVKTPGIEQEILFNEPLLAALPASHPLADYPPTLQELSTLKIITFPPGPGPSFASLVHSFFYQRGLKLSVVQQVNDLQTALSLVASDMGFTLVPEQVSRVQRDGVVYIPLADQNITSAVIASRRANDPPRAIMRLANTILEELVENRLTGRYP